MMLSFITKIWPLPLTLWCSCIAFTHAVLPAYSQVLAENIWGRALTQVTAWGVDPERVADLAIARIKEIFQNWEQ